MNDTANATSESSLSPPPGTTPSEMFPVLTSAQQARVLAQPSDDSPRLQPHRLVLDTSLQVLVRAHLEDPPKTHRENLKFLNPHVVWAW
jgi:hypothetical protein